MARLTIPGQLLLRKILLPTLLPLLLAVILLTLPVLLRLPPHHLPVALNLSRHLLRALQLPRFLARSLGPADWCRWHSELQVLVSQLPETRPA